MYERQLIRGTIVNAVSVLAKLIHPLFFVAATWMFGTEVMGVYLVGTFLLQIATATITAGYFQGTILFASPHVESGAEDEVYRVLGNAAFTTLAISLVLLGAALLGIDPLIARFYPDRPELGPVLRVLAFSLPATALGRVAIGGTKAKMIMEYEAAINGFLKPFAMLGFALLAWALDAGLMGLALAHAATEILLGVLSVWAYQRHFSLVRTVARMGPRNMDWELLNFAVPMSLNMTFNRYLTRLDVIMLAAFGVSNHMVAFYAAGALIASALREVRLTFSGALGPIVARHHAAGEVEAIEELLGRVSRWTTTLILPLLAVLVVLRDDVFRIIDAGFIGDTRFLVVLLFAPFVSCAIGLAGNFIVFTRHSRWNLMNAVLVAGLNTLLNWHLIPRYGLLGAAVATAIATLIVGVLQVVELAVLEKVRMRARDLLHPYAGILFFGLALAATWDPVALTPLPLRIVFALGLVGGFFLLMLLLGHEEVRVVARRLQRRLRPRLES